LLGTRLVNPQDLWWGPMSPGLALTLAVIVTGGLVIVSRLRMLGLVAAFWLTFAAGTGLLAASGHCMTARWHVGQVCGGSFWSVLALSPEILVFMFFMITDPKTTPAGQVARAVYGASVAFLATLLVAPGRRGPWRVLWLGSASAVRQRRSLPWRSTPASRGSTPRSPPRWLRQWARTSRATWQRRSGRLRLRPDDGGPGEEPAPAPGRS